MCEYLYIYIFSILFIFESIYPLYSNFDITDFINIDWSINIFYELPNPDGLYKTQLSLLHFGSQG